MALQDTVLAKLEESKPAVLAQAAAAGLDGVAIAQADAKKALDAAFGSDPIFDALHKPAVEAAVAEHTAAAVAAIGGGEAYIWQKIQQAASAVVAVISKAFPLFHS